MYIISSLTLTDRQIRRWALALIYYYRSILYYCWGRFVGNLNPTPTLESFWERPLNVWIGHQQKTIPALRSEEQVPALGVPPGVGRCRQRTPLPLCLMRRHLFALAWADAKGTGDAERESVTFRKRKLQIVYLIGWLRQAKPSIVCLIGNLSPGGESFRLCFNRQAPTSGAIDFIQTVGLQSKPLIIFTPHSLYQCVRA